MFSDTDECAVSNGGCSHQCVNTAPGYRCECPGPEFSLSSDNKTCVGKKSTMMTTRNRKEYCIDFLYGELPLCNCLLSNTSSFTNIARASFVFNYDISLGGAVASWLARSTLERALRVRALAGKLCCVLGQDTLLSRRLSPPRCMG